MTDKESTRRKSRPFRLLLWLVGPFAVVLLIVCALCLTTVGGPSQAEITKLRQQFETVRRQLPAAPASAAPAPIPARRGLSTTSTTPSAAETDQQRCDKLFLEVINAYHGPYDPREFLYTTPWPRHFVDGSGLRRVHELAMFDEKGIRASSEARREFRLHQGKTLGALADLLTCGMEEPGYGGFPGMRHRIQSNDPVPRFTDKELARLLETLRFLRVAGCPAWGVKDGLLEAHGCIGKMLDPAQRAWDAPPPLPPALAKMELDLLAPRRLDDWLAYLGQVLDMQRGLTEFRQEMTAPAFYFHARRRVHISDLSSIEDNIRERGRISPMERIIGHGGSFVAATLETVIRHRSEVDAFRYQMLHEQSLLEYARAALIEERAARIHPSMFDQLRKTDARLTGRVLAAALELRRGAPIPDPSAVTPESYFFDPVTRRPLRLYRAAAGPGAVRLYLLWPTSGNLKDDRRVILDPAHVYQVGASVLLPPGHPGLERVPEIK